jgi:stalled ribosome rescue protein Dom34
MNHDNTKHNIKGLILGGPAEMKNKIRNHSIFNQYFGTILINIVTISTINNNTVWEVYYNSIEDFITSQDKEGIKLLNRINTMISKGNDSKLVYGINEVSQQLSYCNLEYILMDSNINNTVKKTIYNNNTYGCKIYELQHVTGIIANINIIGIRWY